MPIYLIGCGTEIALSGATVTSENYPEGFNAGPTCDVNIQLSEDQIIVLTFVDFELKRYGSALEIYDTSFSPMSFVKSFISYHKPGTDKMSPVTLSGNKGLIRLRSYACPNWDKNCDNGKGFKIRVGVGKAWNILYSITFDCNLYNFFLY